MNPYKLSTQGLVIAIVVSCSGAKVEMAPSADAAEEDDNASCDCPAGLPGPQGAPGPQGPPGEAAVCMSGLDSCPPGVQGPVGAQGPSGRDGRDGKDGSSCTVVSGNDTIIVACPDGTSGTLAPVPGPQGERGPVGPAGPAGADGADGKDGAAGPPGESVGIDTDTIYQVTGEGQALSGFERADAYCEYGDVLLSGGCTTINGIHESRPVLAPNEPRWTCRGDIGAVVTAYALCYNAYNP